MTTTVAESGSVRVAGTEIAYYRVGEGPPLVVVHGGPGMGHAYMRGLDLLADGRQLVYYDQRGSGASTAGDPSRITFAGSIADLEGLREALGIEQLDLLGHSLGAWIAILYAVAHPDRVHSLVLANTGPPAVPELMKKFGAKMEASRTPEDRAELERIESSEAYADRDPATLEQLYRLRYTPFFRERANASLFEPRFTAITAENVLEFVDRMMRDFSEHDPIGSLERIPCPTLVIHGELDPIPEEFARLLVERIPSARYARIEKASHFAFLEDRGRFVEAVEPFLSVQL
jgi:proline iminopeptidase